jgi:membrane protease YdiL (CAAX protease family)
MLSNLYLPYGLLGGSLFSHWLSKALAGFLFLGSLVVGFLNCTLRLEAFLVVLALVGLLYLIKNNSNKWLKAIGHLGFFVFCFLLFFHKVPGFNNFRVLESTQFCLDCAPYTMYLNAENAIIGFLLLSFLVPVARSFRDWRVAVQSALVWTPLCIVALIGSATLIGYVRFDPRLPSTLLLWSLNNFLLVCIGEEAFFRGYVQKNLTEFCQRHNFSYLLAIGAASILFGLRHAFGGIPFVALSTIAGFFYGMAYHKSGRIEASILTHFCLNLAHFLFFSYPFLMPSH